MDENTTMEELDELFGDDAIEMKQNEKKQLMEYY